MHVSAQFYQYKRNEWRVIILYIHHRLLILYVERGADALRDGLRIIGIMQCRRRSSQEFWWVPHVYTCNKLFRKRRKDDEMENKQQWWCDLLTKTSRGQQKHWVDTVAKVQREHITLPLFPFFFWAFSLENFTHGGYGAYVAGLVAVVMVMILLMTWHCMLIWLGTSFLSMNKFYVYHQ